MKKCMVFPLLMMAGLVFSGDSLSEALKEGKLLADIRFRLEYVDQDTVSKQSMAATLRTRLGYETAEISGFRFLVEFENVTAADDDSYNSTNNGVVIRPVVADPEGTELNRANFVYGFSDATSLKVGRQRIIQNNARFVGNVGWRQNEQTFDAVTLNSKSGKHGFSGSYLNNVNRIFGEDHANPFAQDTRLDGLLLNYGFNPSKAVDLAVFAHAFDFTYAPAASHWNLGFLYRGSKALDDNRSLIYDLSYVKQSEFRDGSSAIDADYIAGSFGVKVSTWSFSAHYESLGGDGLYGFQTPLATLHGFNGWADVFLTTPEWGLVDYFGKVQYKQDGLLFQFLFHKFESDAGSEEYGTEYDAHFAYTWKHGASAGVKLAHYLTDGWGSDITKVWAYVGYKY